MKRYVNTQADIQQRLQEDLLQETLQEAAAHYSLGRLPSATATRGTGSGDNAVALAYQIKKVQKQQVGVSTRVQCAV